MSTAAAQPARMYRSVDQKSSHMEVGDAVGMDVGAAVGADVGVAVSLGTIEKTWGLDALTLS